jgi:hypothetical protein
VWRRVLGGFGSGDAGLKARSAWGAVLDSGTEAAEAGGACGTCCQSRERERDVMRGARTVASCGADRWPGLV